MFENRNFDILYLNFRKIIHSLSILYEQNMHLRMLLKKILFSTSGFRDNRGVDNYLRVLITAHIRYMT